MSSSTAENLRSVRQRVIESCARCSRAPGEVILVAVTKLVNEDKIMEAISEGQSDFGENYVTEGVAKIRELKKVRGDLKFHFIGNLQRNKVRKVVSEFGLIHTVDRFEVAQEISKQGANLGKSSEILVQVNISRQASKSGVKPEVAVELLKRISVLHSISVKGLMTIGTPFSVNTKEITSGEFREMRDLLFRASTELGMELPLLSMGMSDDFELAIECGATIVRVGSGIFGERRQ